MDHIVVSQSDMPGKCFLRWAAITICAIVAITAFAGTARAFAPGDHTEYLETAQGTIRVAYYSPQGYGYKNKVSLITSGHSKSKPSGVKLYNRRVSYIQKRGGEINVFFKRPGTAKLTYHWKGKKHSVKLVCVKYANPVSKLNVGKHTYAKRFRWGNDVTSPYIMTGKLSIRAKSGWKLVSIRGSVNDGWSFPLKLKNNEPLPILTTDVYLVLHNEKTGLKQELFLRR